MNDRKFLDYVTSTIENQKPSSDHTGSVVHKASGKEICKFYQNRYPGSTTLMRLV